METRQDDYAAFTETNAEADTVTTHQEYTEATHPNLRRSGRAKRIRGYQPEQHTDEYTNNDKLGVYAVEGMGYGLFAKQDFSIKDRLICVYHGK